MKRLMLGIAIVALWSVTVQSDLAAQEARLSPGTDIRLLVTPDRDIRGELVEWNADTLRLQDPASGFVHVVSTLEIERLRVRQPRTTGQGALRGLLWGSIVGALSLGAVGASDPFFGPGAGFLIGAAVGGVGGGGVGAPVGSMAPGERWVDSDLQP